MKVIDKCEDPRKIQFFNIEIGDCFFDDENTLMIKTDGSDYNAVSLEYGQNYHFYDNEKFLVVKAKVIIDE